MFLIILNFRCFLKSIKISRGEEPLKLTEVQKAGIGRQTTKGIGAVSA